MPPWPPLADLYYNNDADLYTTFLALNPMLSLDTTTSLDATAGVRPRRCRLP
jgi:hypothetical protein